jgi:tetratricopeptide (TPR) repeat protein
LSRIELVGLGLWTGPGLASAALAAGWAGGAGTLRVLEFQPRLLRLCLAAATVALWVHLLGAPAAGTWTAVGGTAGGMGLVVALTHRSAHARPRAAVVGMGLGLVGAASGITSLVGVRAAVGSVIALGLVTAAARTPCRAEAPVGSTTGRPALAPSLLLWGQMGLCGALLLGVYGAGVRSLSYAGADLGVALLLGCGLVWTLAGSGAPGAGRLLAGALGMGGVALVCTYGFTFYPDLMVSGSAIAQASVYRIEVAHLFPFWCMACLLGAVARLTWWGGWGLAATAVGAAFYGALGGKSAGAAALAVALGAGVVFAVVTRHRFRAANRAVSIGSAALVGGMCAWTVLADPALGWRGLRETLSTVSGVRHAPWSMRVQEVRRLPDGTEVTLQAGEEVACFANGELVSLGTSGRALTTASDRLLVAVAMAYAPPVPRVALVAPVDAEVLAGVRLATDGREPAIISPGSGAGPFDVILCARSVFSSRQNPYRVLSVEGLRELAGRLDQGGVLGTWLPAGWAGPETVISAVATMCDVFPDCDVFAARGEAVVVASCGARMDYGALRRMFGRPGVGQWLRAAGLWGPEDVLLAFTADGRGAALTAVRARPFRLGRRRRPPALARDLSAPARVDGMAALLQHRAAGFPAVLARTRFANVVEEAIASRGLAVAYGDLTRRMLRALGGGGVLQAQQMKEFVSGPFCRRELLAPGHPQGPVQAAAALTALGMDGVAAGLLTEALQGGQDGFALRMAMVEAMAAEHPTEAITHCRRALTIEPASMPAHRRLAALLLAAGEPREAVATLERLLRIAPDSVPDLLMLANLRARWGPMADVRELATRVLDLEPHNAEAQLLLELSSGGNVVDAPPEGASLQGSGASREVESR